MKVDLDLPGAYVRGDVPQAVAQVQKLGVLAELDLLGERKTEGVVRHQRIQVLIDEPSRHGRSHGPGGGGAPPPRPPRPCADKLPARNNTNAAAPARRAATRTIASLWPWIRARRLSSCEWDPDYSRCTRTLPRGRRGEPAGP